MLVDDKKKDLLRLLLARWNALIHFAAIEEVHKESVAAAESIGLELPLRPDLDHIKPTAQIEIIKNYIIDLIPEARFMSPLYEPPACLCPKDFIDMYISHNEMSISKVEKLIKNMDIT